MLPEGRLLKAVTGCMVTLFLLNNVHELLAADIAWEQAQEMLRKGHGIPNSTPESVPPLGQPAENPDEYGAEANPTGDPIGGGVGYRDIKTSGDFTVGTTNEFLAALEQAKSGQVVYVKPDAQIDLTGHVEIAVPEGVIVAGNRGKDGSAGPLLYETERGEGFMVQLFVVGARGRMTGLRIKGPDPGYTDYTNETKNALSQKAACGIRMGHDSEIDNCEVSHFFREGVRIRAKNVRIHHNFIHDIMAYPIIVLGSPGFGGVVQANIIHWGWHATAGTGDPGTGYEASYNILKPQEIASVFGTVSHCLDQHPYRALRRRGREPEHLVAGDWLHWHHNTISLDGPRTSPRTTIGAKIRGTPQSVAKVHNNWFKTENVWQALGPYGGGSGPGEGGGNIWVYDNAFGPEKRKLTRIISRTTPQILMKTPPPPELEAHSFNEKLAIDVEINTLKPLRLAGVIVKLDEKELWLQPRAPEPGEVVIDAAKLSEGEHRLTVSAVDNRGALGTQSVYIKAAD